MNEGTHVTLQMKACEEKIHFRGHAFTARETLNPPHRGVRNRQECG